MALSIGNSLKFAWVFIKLKWVGWVSQPNPLPGGVLDPQVKLLLLGQQLLGEKALTGQVPQAARKHFDANFPLLRKIGGKFERVDSTRDLEIPGPGGGIRARLYRMNNSHPQPLLVYFHGGGWVLGNCESADNICRYFCKQAGMVILSIDYRLAPEYRFPAAVEDSITAFIWAHDHAAELGADPTRIFAGGDSAGGNLTAVIAQELSRKGEPLMAGQILLYAALDSAHLDTPSYHEFGGKALGLPLADVEWFLENYAPNPRDRLDPRLSPALQVDLRGLPPALVVTAEFDVLRDEGEAYAQKLLQAGNAVKLIRCNGMQHGFLSMVGLIRRVDFYFKQIIEELGVLSGD